MTELNMSDLAAYKDFFEQAKLQIQKTQLQAMLSTNRKLITLYWWIGEHIVQSQKKYGWGKSVVEHLSKDLRITLGGKFGFSVQNLWYMRQFYLEYKNKPDLQQLVGEIPWGQNLLIMSRIKDSDARMYYIKATIQCAWSRDILSLQINAKAYERQVLAKNNIISLLHYLRH